MELRHLRYFTAVAAHGTFRKAAATLHLTQPALSRQVRDLEDELGVMLIKRGKNFATLTDAGDLFYEEAREVLARVALAVERVRTGKQTEVLRVGYGPTLTSGVMPTALERFQAAAPRVRVELCDLSPREMCQQAAKRELDLLIVPGEGKAVAKDFRWTEFRRQSLVLVLPASHPLAQLKRIPPQRLSGIPLIGLGREYFPGYAEHMRALLKPFDVRPNFVKMLNDGVSAMFAELEANHAAGILADGILHAMPRALVARPFSPAFPPIVVQIGLPAAATNPHAEMFARLLREEAARLKRG